MFKKKSFKHKHHIKPRKRKTKNSPVCNFEGSNTYTKIKNHAKENSPASSFKGSYLQLLVSKGPISSFQFQKVLYFQLPISNGPISSFQFQKVLSPVSNFKRSKHTVSTHTHEKELAPYELHKTKRRWMNQSRKHGTASSEKTNKQKSPLVVASTKQGASNVQNMRTSTGPPSFLSCRIDLRTPRSPAEMSRAEPSQLAALTRGQGLELTSSSMQLIAAASGAGS